jgi:ATP-dependent helicase/nuclease subunit A
VPRQLAQPRRAALRRSARSAHADAHWGRRLAIGGVPARAPRPSRKPGAASLDPVRFPTGARTPSAASKRARRGRWRRRDRPRPRRAPPPSRRACARRRGAGRCSTSLFERLPAVAPAERRPPRCAGSSARGRQPTKPRATKSPMLVCAIIGDPASPPCSARIRSPKRRSPRRSRRPRRRRHGRPAAGRGRPRSVIDFKTGRVPPTPSGIPASHRAQMEAYAEALRVIFPGRTSRRPALHRRPR